MNKISFELSAILAGIADGKGVAAAQSKAQEIVDAMEARGFFDIGDEAVVARYEGPPNHGPQAAMTSQGRQPMPPKPSNGGGPGKEPGGQIVTAGGPRSVGQSRTVNMTGGNQQPQSRSTNGTRGGASQGRGVAPPVVVQVGQGKPVL